MSGSGYPTDSERDAQRAYRADRDAARSHAQPCKCSHCYDIRTDREWREYQDKS